MAILLGFFALVNPAQAGWGCGRGWGGGWRGGCGWGGGWRGGYGCGWGGGWRGGGCGWGGWGWNAFPAINLAFLAPPVVAYPVYQQQPVYVTQGYNRSVTYVVQGNSSAVRVQTRLARLGFYVGPIDGSIGRKTSDALRSYQSAYGLPVTGQVDQRTLISLGV